MYIIDGRTGTKAKNRPRQGNGEKVYVSKLKKKSPESKRKEEDTFFFILFSLCRIKKKKEDGWAGSRKKLRSNSYTGPLL